MDPVGAHIVSVRNLIVGESHESSGAGCRLPELAPADPCAVFVGELVIHAGGELILPNM